MLGRILNFFNRKPPVVINKDIKCTITQEPPQEKLIVSEPVIETQKVVDHSFSEGLHEIESIEDQLGIERKPLKKKAQFKIKHHKH